MRTLTLALMLTILALGCTASPDADFTITGKPLGPPIVGFGACMNPYLYTYPNMPREISEDQVKVVESKVKALRPQFVRIFFLNSWMEKDTDPSIADNHPGMRDSLIRTLRLAQDSGAQILLQFWYDPDRYKNADDVMHRFARHIKTLREDHGLTAIRFATVQNEPDENADDVRMNRYSTVYRAFGKALRDEGLRDQIKIIAGDLVGEYQHHWIPMLGRELAPIVDGYSVHSYWDYWDIRKFRRHLDDTRAHVDALPEDQRRPLYVTEFGARGFREHPSIEPGQSDTRQPLCDVPVYSFEIAIYLLDALNRGFVATAQWDLYDAWYDRKMGYGLIADVTRSFAEKPGYHLLQMFTHHTRPGMRAMKIDGAIEDFWLTDLRDPTTRNQSLILLNRIKSPKTVTLAGLPPNRTFQVWQWNFNSTGELSSGGRVRSDARGVVTRTIPHMGVELLTTIDDSSRDRNRS